MSVDALTANTGLWGTMGWNAAVVDDITVRNGKNFVAMRDPAFGRQYFTPIDEFKSKFMGQAIITSPKK